MAWRMHSDELSAVNGQQETAGPSTSALKEDNICGGTETRAVYVPPIARARWMGHPSVFCSFEKITDSQDDKACGGKRNRLAGGAALGHDGVVQAVAEVGGELVDLVLAVDGDGLAGGVEDDLAVMALADVRLDFRHQFGVDATVEVISKLGEKISAGHDARPSFFCRK